MLKKNKLALKNIKWASNDLKEFPKNSPKAINYAVCQLESAMNYYDGANGMDMHNLFEMLGIVNITFAIDNLNCVAFDSDNKNKQKSVKQDIQEIRDSKYDYILLTNYVVGNNPKLTFITTNFLQTLIKNIKKVISFKPYLYKLDAKLGYINTAFRGLTNYLISINKTNLLKKNHLAERNSIQRNLDLFTNTINRRLYNTLKDYFNVDVFKVNHFNKFNMSIALPTINDINTIVNSLK